MGIRNFCCVISLLVFLPGLLFAQEGNTPSVDPSGVDTIYSSPIEGEPSFRLSGTEDSLLFFQRLKWEVAQYAISYHVILERKRDNLDMYAEVLRRIVNEPFLDVSVPSGEYRFRVMSFNILGLLDSQSDWEYFRVIQALKPTIIDFSPSAFYFDRLTPRIIALVGENLLPDSEIYLVNRNIVTETGESVVIRPREIHRNELGENANLLFNEDDLVSGRYEIVVVNPGGLTERVGTFTIAMAKPFDINVSAGYSPLLTILGQTDFFLDGFIVPVSFALRASFVPFKWDFGNLGFEVSPMYSNFTSEKNGDKTSAHIVVVNFNAMFQYWFQKNKLSLIGRAGLGFAGIFDYHWVTHSSTGNSGSSENFSAFSFNFGAAVQYQFYQQFFAEGGLDYMHLAHSDFHQGFIRVGLFAGYQF